MSQPSNKYRFNANGAAKESPWDRASLPARYWLSFMLPLFRKAFKKELTIEDMGAPPRVDESKTLGLRLQHSFNQELITKKEPSLITAYFKTFGSQLLLLSFLDLFSKCVAYPMQTIALGWLIRDAGLYITNTAIPPPADGPLNTTITPEPTTTTTTTTTTPPTDIVAQLNSDDIFWRVVIDAIYLMVFTWFAIVSSHPFFFQTYHMGMKCRVAACHLIYKKALRLNQSAMSETTVGQMVNLLSNDVNRFDQVVQLFPYIFIAPLQAILLIVLLSTHYLGAYPTLASLAAVVLYVVVQTSMGRGFQRFRSRTAKRTDERVRLMNEIILAMRIIKMYAWEMPFKQLVYAARKREITTIAISYVLKAINQTLFFVSSKIIVFVALMTYVLLGYQLEPEIVFVTIGLANLIRISLTLFFPNAVAYCAETVISCRRITKFLLLPEIENSPATYKASNDAYGCKHVIAANKIYASWAGKEQDVVASSDSRWAILRNLSVAIKARDLVLVIGRVGSGKSSFLMSVLGELPIISGRLEVNGRISYASQEAWIFSGTIRENILFGKNFDSARYNEVVRVCSLERDLDILIDGDATIVGERGVSLSGGQKARVNLARALYNEADVYLLDDPLSAVDAPVAKHIFNESLRVFLRKKTVILATHQLQFLRNATKVLVMDRDCPCAFGSLKEVMESDAFASIGYGKEAFLEATTTETETDAAARTIQNDDTQSASGSGSRRSRSTPGQSSSSSSSRSPPKLTSDSKDGESEGRLIRHMSQASSNLNESLKTISPFESSKSKKGSAIDIDDAPAEQKAMSKQATGSDRRYGTEKLSAVSSDMYTYLYYLRNASGPAMFIWFVLMNLAAQVLYVYTDYFLSFWTDSVQRKEVQGADFVQVTYVDGLNFSEISGLYAGLVAACLFTAFLRASTFFIASLRASINIHDKLFKSIVHAPMRFFDFSPIGILLNRLSRDIGFVDETMPATAIEIVTIFVNIAGILILTVILDYTNLFGSLVLLGFAYLFRRVCAKTITRLKQIEGVTRSPIFSHLSTTLAGLPTIRAFKVQDDFMRIFDKYQDTHSSAWFNYICSGRWLTVHMDWICLIFITSVVTILLAFRLDATNASLIGLLISQTIVLPGPFQWGIRQLIEVESQMTSVQRIKEFSELESESELMNAPKGADEGPNDDLLGGGSHQAGYQVSPTALGEIKFDQLSLSYFEDEPPVLRNLSFAIKSAEKVGIIGRTGAGKSSIVSVLFRLYDFEGTIEIDGLSTKSMQLSQLRRSMSIIPQDPILFGGTLRKNLDPFSEYSDTQLWDALEAVQLKSLFKRYNQGLDFVISESGSNFSVGQRQLICLARAIVRRNKILVLDEATANVDPETDVFIQKTIAQQFDHCTVLTIAHRLITIVDSDRVLVLDRGEIKEFASPFELLSDETSLFSQMVNSVPMQAARIRKLIEDAHLARQQSG